jgi:predicted TIM-barrel fold metal-dependent hydrolase
MTAITYKMSLDFIEKTKEISEENKKIILGENAKKFYGFKDLPVPQRVKNMVED